MLSIDVKFQPPRIRLRKDYFRGYWSRFEIFNQSCGRAVCVLFTGDPNPQDWEHDCTDRALLGSRGTIGTSRESSKAGTYCFGLGVPSTPILIDVSTDD